MNTTLDIVELIECNPITKLSNTYQNNLLEKQFPLNVDYKILLSQQVNQEK